jgi:glyoxylase-like metal-dependent hydrolase (beta-lactamase superfamily II)
MEVLPGVYWLPTALPWRLSTVNLWLLREVDGWTMVDCGFPLPAVREEIENAWAATLGKQPITRLIVTHHHPDHVGNCRWICERWGIVPIMTRMEHELAITIMGPGGEDWSERRTAFWQQHGLPEAVAQEFSRQRNAHQEHFRALPERWEPIAENSVLRIGGAAWQVIVAEGHSPEQALLYSPERNTLISGDQILPRIVTNISLSAESPPDPIARFLRSNERIARICADPFVLPSHNVPFRGLQARIAALARARQERLAKIQSELKPEPQTAAELIPALFGDLYNAEVPFAIGDVIAQLYHLAKQGRAQRLVRNGTVYFTAV